MARRGRYERRGMGSVPAAAESLHLQVETAWALCAFWKVSASATLRRCRYLPKSNTSYKRNRTESISRSDGANRPSLPYRTIRGRNCALAKCVRGEFVVEDRLARRQTKRVDRCLAYLLFHSELSSYSHPFLLFYISRSTAQSQ